MGQHLQSFKSNKRLLPNEIKALAPSSISSLKATFFWDLPFG
jgi:hypothetical protein